MPKLGHQLNKQIKKVALKKVRYAARPIRRRKAESSTAKEANYQITSRDLDINSSTEMNAEFDFYMFSHQKSVIIIIFLFL